MPFPPLPGENETEERITDPQPGYYFSEITVYYVYVVYREDDYIEWISISPPGTLPDDGDYHKTTVEEFAEYHSYGKDRDYWVCYRGTDERALSWRQDIVSSKQAIDQLMGISFGSA